MSVSFLTYDDLLQRALERGEAAHQRVLDRYEDAEWKPEIIVIIDFIDEEVKQYDFMDWEDGTVSEWLEESELVGRYDKEYTHQIDFELEEDATYFMMVWGWR